MGIAEVQVAPSEPTPKSKDVISNLASHELVFAVVGHVGSGASTVADAIKAALEDEKYDVTLIKARDVIERWAVKEAHPISTEDGSIQRSVDLQNAGDKMREGGDHAAVAAGLIGVIRQTRALKTKQELLDGCPVLPDGAKRAYILDSIRHPAEVELLRRLYGPGFALVGVVCQEDRRLSRLDGKFPKTGPLERLRFVERDAKAPQKHGQRVSDAYHMSDYFVDNTDDRKTDGRANPDWVIPEQVSRLLKIIEHRDIQRPSREETAMFMAHGARLRSSCLSRQVGAALLDRNGEILATGYNDVPRAGGGICGPGSSDGQDALEDGRCLHTEEGCRSVVEQIEIATAIAEEIPELASALLKDRQELVQRLRATRLGELIEFSRAVHAEMECLLAAARQGKSTQATRMFVTTFPCHFCARHIVSAGVDEVQYIEPYPKSKALQLHRDAITPFRAGWVPPSVPSRQDGETRRGTRHVLFRSFTGVAPRLYARAFLKDRDLKDDASGKLKIGEPVWGHSWYMAKASYAEMEAKVSPKS